MSRETLEKAVGIALGEINNLSPDTEIVTLNYAIKILSVALKMRTDAVYADIPKRPIKSKAATIARDKAIVEFAYQLRVAGKAIGDYYYHELGALVRDGDEQARIARAILAHGRPASNDPVLVRDFIKHDALAKIVRQAEKVE